MSRMVALGAVLGFAVAVLALALFAKEPPRSEPAPRPATAPPALVQPTPLLRPVPMRKDLGPRGPLKAVLPPQARPMVIDAGS